MVSPGPSVFQKYGITSLFMQLPSTTPIYGLEFPFALSLYDLYNVIDLGTRRGYSFVKTNLKLPDEIYTPVRKSALPVYRRDTVVSRMNSSSAADIFKSLNDDPEDTEVYLSPVPDDVGRYFAVSPFPRMGRTNVSGTAKCDDDLNLLNYMLMESSINVYLKRNWNLNFTEFNERMSEITTWNEKRI